MAFPELGIIYRSNSHAPFWIVAEKSGTWERNGLVELLYREWADALERKPSTFAN